MLLMDDNHCWCQVSIVDGIRYNKRSSNIIGDNEVTSIYQLSHPPMLTKHLDRIVLLALTTLATDIIAELPLPL